MDITRLRNIGIAAHIDAGKTTTTEGILFRAGRIHRHGGVDTGDATTDSDRVEQERGITIYSAAVTCEWNDHTINLIDTPGHVDFTAEVERSFRVLDGAVVVFDAKEGVEAQSETVWRQADRHRVPRICLINKMDKLGADFDRSVRTMRERIAAAPLVLHLPLGCGSSFAGFIDLVRMMRVEYSSDGRFVETPLEEYDESASTRTELEEAVADLDDDAAEEYLNSGSVSDASLSAAIRRLTVSGQAHPVFCGSALKQVGVQHLLDAVCDYLPSPADVEHDGLRTDPSAPLAALAFKVVPERTGDLTYVRVYSGTLKAGTRVYNTVRGVKENMTRMYRMHADKREAVPEAAAGDIVAVVGLKKTMTGDTLAPDGSDLVLESIEFPDPVVSMSIEPTKSSDRDRLADAMHTLMRQDPTFKFRYDAETGQTVIAGMGELHLEILIGRLRDHMKVPCSVGKPRVSYREAVTRAAEAEGSFIKQTGGHGQYAAVHIRAEPTAGGEDFEFEDRIRDGAVSRQYIGSVEKGCRSAARSGVLCGYPLLGVKVTLLDGREHDVDSSDMAFEAAARIAFAAAVRKAGPRLMEPIMRVTIIVPDEHFGPVSADIAARGGTIGDSTVERTTRTITAFVPLARMFGYAGDIRSLTKGRASWSMEPARYEPAKGEIV